ncbi:MAG: hypothetical protein WA755_18825 [Candidatus Acidiferrales bacterium]
MPNRMNMFSRLMILERLGLSTDAQTARLDADLNFLPVEPGDFGACQKPFAGFGNVKLDGREQLRLGEKPILAVMSVHTSAALENLKGASGNQIEYVLCMFEKFMNGY